LPSGENANAEKIPIFGDAELRRSHIKRPFSSQKGSGF
jgi:hypothetical protein